MDADATSRVNREASPIRLAIAAPVAVLTLSRPETRNALSLAMMTALLEALAEVGKRREVRVVLIQSDAPVFCAGHDLKELTAHRSDADGGAAFFARTFSLCSDLMRAIGDLSQPVIAALEGVATAAGCQLVASCDLAIAGAGARFATPGVNIGLFCATPGVALIRALAPKHAMEMLLSGEMIDAETALRFGLINRVATRGDALKAARAWAEHLGARSPSALLVGKRSVRAQQALALSEAYEQAGRVMVDGLSGEDAIEGIDAFLTKRSPSWPE